MFDTSCLIELLAAQKEIFSKIEEITNQMLFAPAEELQDLTNCRGELLQKAVNLNEELSTAAKGDERILNVIRCSCNVSDLPQELAGVFEAALRVKAVVNRINMLEDDVLDRVKDERGMAKSKIESLNRSSNSVAEKYRHAVQTGVRQDTFLDRSRSV